MTEHEIARSETESNIENITKESDKVNLSIQIVKTPLYLPLATAMAEPPLPYFENEEKLKAVSGENQPMVLVLGGSTFMGRETVDALLQMPARVCVVNRGRAYWGTRDPTGGHTARITADRRDKNDFAQKIDAVTTRQKEPWSLVADFSAYDGNDINAALEGLRGRFSTYAYISSDSVYEVSTLAAAGWTTSATSRLVSENCSQRPADLATRSKLRKADGYGDGKLEAEEALAAGLAENSRAVALRLPDVLGPYDDTFRLWAYWHWWNAGEENRPEVQKCLKRPSPDSTDVDSGPPLAFVFSRDVARFLLHLIGRNSGTSFDAVNLGSDLQLPLKGFLELLAKVSGKPDTSPRAVDRPKSFLPSVDRSIPLDFRKLKEHYAFTCTPLEEVLKICADWFQEACKIFPEEAAEACMKLPQSARAAALAHSGLEMPTPRSSSSSSSS